MPEMNPLPEDTVRHVTHIDSVERWAHEPGMTVLHLVSSEGVPMKIELPTDGISENYLFDLPIIITVPGGSDA